MSAQPADVTARTNTRTADLDAAAFPTITAAFPAGRTVVTARAQDGSAKVFSAHALTSVSLNPPTLLVCVSNSQDAQGVLQHTRRFAVNYLKDGGDARESGEVTPDQLVQNTADELPTVGEGVIADASCETEHQIQVGDQIVLIARICHARAHKPQLTRLYYRGPHRRWPR